MFLSLVGTRQLVYYAGRCEFEYPSRCSSLTLCSFHLVRNRNVLERLQKEIAVVPEEGDITREEIQRLPYLRCCLNESRFCSYPRLNIVDVCLSLAAVPNTADECPVREQSHHITSRRRSRRHFTRSIIKRRRYCLVSLSPSSCRGPIRTRLEIISPREMGKWKTNQKGASRSWVSRLQWRSKGMPRE
jgi:hypothetical protein